VETSPDRKTVRVTIFHQSYSLSAAGEPGEVESLAEAVDELMSSIASRAGNVDSNRVAVLACLHLIDRLRSAEKDLAAFKQRVESKSREFSLLLDQAAGS
jgi:cell division protein ZapA